MPRVITNKDLKEACLKAMEEGTLLALAPGYNGGCYYAKEFNGKVYNCAVGSALTPEERSEVFNRGENGATAHGLNMFMGDLFTFEDVSFAQTLQGYHDDIVNAVLVENYREKPIQHLKDFLEAA